MKGFRKVKLNDITVNLDKIRIPLSSYERSKLEKKYPYYGAQGIIDYVDNFIFDGEYLLVAEDGENLKSQKNKICNFVNGQFWVNNHAHILQANEENDIKYIYYKLNLINFRPYISGSAQPKLTQDNLNKIELTIHDLKNQQKIATVLSTLDSKIELNNRINTELEAMAKTLYDYWFVQFDFPDANGKPYKTSGGKMVYNAALKREIPEGWDADIVGNVLGKTPASNKVLNQEILLTGSIPVIDQSKDYICGFTDDKSALINPTQPHIVFGDHTRIIKLVNFKYARGADGTQVLISNNKRMPGYLLYQTVAGIDLSNYGYARHFKFLKDSKIVIPDDAIAARYHGAVTPWFEKIKEGVFENQQLMLLRDWLLPMLMNGQVTVVNKDDI